MRSPTAIRTTAAAVVATALFLAAPARAQDAHGAIALGRAAQGEAVTYGFTWNYAARDEAKDAAMSACLAGGGTDCAVLAWWWNGCGALALDRYGGGQGSSGMSREHAEARALRNCEAKGRSGCAVVGSQCTSPGGQAGTYSGSENVLAAPEEPDGGTAGRTAGGDRPAETVAPRDEALTRAQRIRVQRGLSVLGFEAGPADGMFGRRTRSAIWEWQQAKGLEATGYLTADEAETLAAAGAAVRETPAPRRAASEAGPRNRSRNEVLYFAAAGPKCTEMPKGSVCWLEISNKPGCFISNPNNVPGESTTWSGGCSGDTAHGKGTLGWTSSNGDTQRHTGELAYGKFHGRWVMRYANGNVSEGPYVAGKWEGRWVTRYANGIVTEGPYVAGKREGRWVARYPNGDRLEEEWSNGSREGRPGVYVNKEGQRFPGTWSDGCFIDRGGRARARSGNRTWKECRNR